MDTAPAANPTTTTADISVPAKTKKLESEFARLRRDLRDATSVSEFVARTIAVGRGGGAAAGQLRRRLNTVMQILSHRDDAMYEGLFNGQRGCVVTLLSACGRCYDAYARPPAAAHEFLLRCERHGVFESTWTVAGDGSTDGKALKAVLKAMCAIDGIGALKRRVEMCESVREVCEIAGLLQSPPKCLAKLRPEERVVIISHFCSRSRRLLDDASQQQGPSGVDSSLEDDVMKLLTMVLNLINPSEGPAPRRLQLWVDHVCAKFTLPAEVASDVDKWRAANTAAGDTQVKRMERVLNLKECVDADDDALTRFLDGIISTEDGHDVLEDVSPDILSGLAVAASSRPVGNDVRSKVATVLRHAATVGGVSLPRRALRFLASDGPTKRPRSPERE